MSSIVIFPSVASCVAVPKVEALEVARATLELPPEASVILFVQVQPDGDPDDWVEAGRRPRGAMAGTAWFPKP